MTKPGKREASNNPEVGLNDINEWLNSNLLYLNIWTSKFGCFGLQKNHLFVIKSLTLDKISCNNNYCLYHSKIQRTVH